MSKPLQTSLFQEKGSSCDVSADSHSDEKDTLDCHAYSIKPLAARMRAKSIHDIVGQEHILGENCLIPKLLRSGHFTSMLFYGPPGCGKTSLAEVIARETQSHFVRINAVSSNVAELRDVLRMARYRTDARSILFIDEIHRFNKAQQDLLLPDVEEGHIGLIGATTHNPGFYIIPPLLSRSHLFRLEPLSIQAITCILEKALYDKKDGLGSTQCSASKSVLTSIAQISDGDLRKALNALETIALSQPMKSEIVETAVIAFAKERQIRYDRNEADHYDTFSAFIKSIRGCDPDASLYWLTKMLEGGEDPRAIARRLIIIASEDVGLGDSRGLPIAVAAFQACEYVGMPECAINLSHATVFLATAPKSNASYIGLLEARACIQKEALQEVPLWIKDTHNKIGPIKSQEKEYLYSHDFPENISGQDYMLQPKTFYKPKNVGAESVIQERIARLKILKHNKQKQN